MPRITISSVREQSVCDGCGRVTSVVKITDGGFVLFYVCRDCWKELDERVTASYRQGETREALADDGSERPPAATA